jgi:hypothetical protein
MNNRYICPVIYTHAGVAAVGAEVDFSSTIGSGLSSLSITPQLAPITVSPNISGFSTGLGTSGMTASNYVLPSFGAGSNTSSLYLAPRTVAPASTTSGIGSIFTDLGKGLSSFLGSSGGQSLIGSLLAPKQKAPVYNIVNPSTAGGNPFSPPGSILPQGIPGLTAPKPADNTLLYVGVGVALLAGIVLLSNRRANA